MQRGRRFTALPLLLSHVGSCFNHLEDLIRIVICASVVSRWSFRRFLLDVPFVHQRNVLVDHVVLHVGWSTVVGLCQLRNRAAVGPLVLPFTAGGTQFPN